LQRVAVNMRVEDAQSSWCSASPVPHSIMRLLQSMCVLQRVAVWCSALQCSAVCCSVLQCVAVCCSVLQCVAANMRVEGARGSR